MRRLFLFMAALLLAAVPMAAQDTPDPMTVSFEEACGSVTVENPNPSALCLEVMALRPAPTYAQAPLDSYSINTYSFWKVTGEAPTVFDAPNGNGLRVMEAGFNFVRAIDTSIEGWVQIEGGEWMQTADLTLAQPSIHRGVLLDGDLSEPFAWVLGNVFTAPYPGGSQAAETGVRKWRYNIVYVFATVELDGWRWYMVGPNQWIEQRMVSKILPAERPEGVSGRWVAVDLYEQTLVAYEDDTPTFATVIASGLPEWETNEGLFTVWYRLPAGEMSGAAGAPDAYALQSVPWTMYFDNDISLHGAYWHDGFGYRRSHGCVNLTLSDSRWLYEWTAEATAPLDDEGRLQTFVYVYSSDEYKWG